MSDYQEKYLKYKNKYVALQLQLGAGNADVLKKAGFSDLTITTQWGKAIKDIPKDEINKMIELKKNGFNEHSAISGSKLNKENYDNLIKLKAVGIGDSYCLKWAEITPTDRINKIILLKQNGFKDYDLAKVSGLSKEQIDHMLQVKKEKNLDNDDAFEEEVKLIKK